MEDDPVANLIAKLVQDFEHGQISRRDLIRGLTHDYSLNAT